MIRLDVLLRLFQVLLHLLTGVTHCALVFPLVTAHRRQQHVKRWSMQLLRILRVRLEIVGATGRVDARQRRVIVSNHVSWVDIFVINAMQPCRFVAKADIRDWPLLGYLCSRAGTIFIARGSTRDVRTIFKQLVATIEAGEQVAFFPEGTTAAQGKLLPFHANLFEAAIGAGVPVQPLAVRYLNQRGDLEADIEYIGDMTFPQSMLKILGGQTITAQIIVLPPIASEGANRRSLALATHDRIRAALGYADRVGA